MRQRGRPARRSFQVLEETNYDDLSTETLEQFRDRAVRVPALVLRQQVELTNDRRRKVPTTLVRCSLPRAQM